MVFQCVAKTGDAVVAGGVEVEGELHKWGALIVDDDGIDEPALELDWRVFVADRRRERCTPKAVLLYLTLADLIGQVLVLVL
ncbi:MAG: hypothetical protein ABSG93_15195 [Solirubrobacteraceae bacterium]